MPVEKPLANPAALSRMVADDFVEISVFGTLRTKADNMRAIGSGVLTLTAVHRDSTMVRIYGDVALLTAIADRTSTLRGTPFSSRIRYMRVFMRRDGHWVAVAVQQTPMQ